MLWRAMFMGAAALTCGGAEETSAKAMAPAQTVAQTLAPSPENVPAAGPGIGPARAQALLITGMDSTVLTSAAAEIGATVEDAGRSGDTQLYRVTYASGLMSIMYFRACENNLCLGLVMTAKFQEPQDSGAAKTDATIRAFSDAHPEIKTFRSADDAPIAQGYIIVDEGVTLKNLVVQMTVFGASAGFFSDILYAE